jgi:hypothetical protein
VSIAAPIPAGVRALCAARTAVLVAAPQATEADAYEAVREALTGLSAAELLDVVAVLACFAGRPGDIRLTTSEWATVRDFWRSRGLDP